MQHLNALPQHIARPKAVLFDWAGTTIDYGSRAPTAVFMEIFKSCGVEITAAEARGPMGRAKRDHIAEIAQLDRVAAAWTSVHGMRPTDDDIQAMYENFLPLQKRALSQGCDIIPGVIETIAWCRAQGLKIGGSTGYTRELMDVVEPIAAANGYAPDVSICSDEVTAGRPAPWMNFRAAERLGVYPMDSIVVVDDTPVGIAAGLAAGCITVAVTKSGNEMGLSLAEVENMHATDLAKRIFEIEQVFQKAGAHFGIHSVAELPEVIRMLQTMSLGG